MDRRLIGVLVLVVAVVAALAGNSRTKQLAGEPLAGPIPGPPATGDCALEPGTAGPGEFDRPGGGEGIDYRSVSLGPCGSGERFGEVIAVFPGGLDYEPPESYRPDESGPYVPDPHSPSEGCSRAGSRYLGYLSPIDEPLPASLWWPAVSTSWELVGPDRLQRAAGQRWLACVVVGYDADWVAGYTGNLRGVIQDLDVPSELAWCLYSLPSADDEYNRVDCSQRHAAELFAAAYPTEVEPHPEGDPDECRAMVASITGMSDPTAGGRLKVIVVRVEQESYFAPPDQTSWDTDIEPTMTTTQYCVLTPADPDDDLGGPLTGLGDGPVPLR